MPPSVISLCSSQILRFSSSFFSTQTLTLTLTLTNHRSQHRISNPSLRHNIKHLSCTSNITSKLSKKARRESPENLLRHHLNTCSKNINISRALHLYDSALADSIPLSLHHYNVLLYLCSHPSATSSDSNRALDIFRRMSIDNITPNEATFTSLVRLASARGDPDLAFHFIKAMSAAGLAPRLRSYGPALFGFCEKGDVEKAHELEAHMIAAEVCAEEQELAALFRVNSVAGRGEDVYRLLQRMRAELRVVSETTAELIEGWFRSDAAAGFGVEEWDAEKVRDGMARGGGGWHGKGWLGKGEWSVGRSEMDKDGVCSRCGDKMICIDIDDLETQVFATSLAILVGKKESKADFAGFQV